MNEVIRSFLFRKKAINANAKLQEKFKENDNHQDCENINTFKNYDDVELNSLQSLQSIDDDDSNSYLEFFQFSELPKELLNTNNENRKIETNDMNENAETTISNYAETTFSKCNKKQHITDDDVKVISTGTIETIDGDEIYIECEIPPKDLKEEQPIPIQTEDGFQCPYCNREFAKKRQTKIHIDRMHLNKKKYKPLTICRLCPICGKASNSHSTYQDHYKKHFPELLHYCRFCKKAFSTIYHCKMHERIHTNEKQFLCERCEYSCITNTQLKVSFFFERHFVMNNLNGLSYFYL